MSAPRPFVKERAAAGDKTYQAGLNCMLEGRRRAPGRAGSPRPPGATAPSNVLNPPPASRPTTPRPPPSSATIWRASSPSPRAPTGRPARLDPWEKGYDLAKGEGRNGSAAAKMTRPAADAQTPACSQHVTLNQAEAKPIIARVWTKAQDVTGDLDNNYALYIDLQFTDGTPGFGHVVGAQGGTTTGSSWRRPSSPRSPFLSLTYHLLFRAPRTGTVWYDDASSASKARMTTSSRTPTSSPPPSPGRYAPPRRPLLRLLRDGRHEPQLPREHFAGAQIPSSSTARTASASSACSTPSSTPRAWSSHARPVPA